MSTPRKAEKAFNFQTHDYLLHQYQEQAWDALKETEIRELGLLAGIQGGKTSFGALATAYMIGKLSKIHPGSNFIVGADNYKTLSQATIPTLLKLIDRRMGLYNQGKQEIVLKIGGKIFFRTSTDPWSVEGIPDCAFAWMDEAGKCSKVFQINVLGRVARLKGKVLYTSTPYALNWLYQDVEKPFISGERKDIKMIRFSSADNPAFPRDEFERQRQLLDARTFRRKYMGIHERMEGLVYELTSDNRTRSIQLPPNTRYFASVDWGYSEGHSFAVSIRAITLDGFQYAVDEFKATSLDPNQQVEVCKTKKALWNIELFGCDPSRPDMIALLNKAGCKAIGFHEGNENYKTVISGITLHNALLRSGRYRVFEDKCPHMLDEYETYHWPEFVEDKVSKETPVKLNDDLMDAERMLTVLTKNVIVRPQAQPFLGAKMPHIDQFDPTKPSRKKKSWDSY